MDNSLKIAISTDPPEDMKALYVYAKDVSPYADFLHFDIMDGKFVKKITYDHKIVSFLKQSCSLTFDVHLMTANPQRQIKKYAKAGANILTIHYESFKNKNRMVKALEKIRKLGMLAGLSIKLETPIEKITNYLKYIDVILIMSVEPGLSGQRFIKDSLFKVKLLDKIRKAKKMKFKIEVDGGINPRVSELLKKEGADIVVSGSYVYNSKNYRKAIFELKGQSTEK